MTEPRRWSGGDDVPPDVARILRAGTRTRAMPKAAGERAKLRLRSMALPTAASVFLGWKGIAIAGIAAAGAVGVRAYATHETATVAVSSRRETTSSAHSSASSAAPEAPSADAVVAAPEEPPTPAPPAAPGLRPRVPAGVGPQNPKDTLASELALLARGRAELEGDPASALHSLDEHAKRFPHGKLAIERELLALDALERLGRRSEARERASRVLARARGTIYEARVRAHIDGTP